MEGREDMIFFATVDVTRFGVCLARYGDFQRHVGWGGNWFILSCTNWRGKYLSKS